MTIFNVVKSRHDHDNSRPPNGHSCSFVRLAFYDVSSVRLSVLIQRLKLIKMRIIITSEIFMNEIGILHNAFCFCINNNRLVKNIIMLKILLTSHYFRLNGLFCASFAFQ